MSKGDDTWTFWQKGEQNRRNGEAGRRKADFWRLWAWRSFAVLNLGLIFGCEHLREIIFGLVALAA